MNHSRLPRLNKVVLICAAALLSVCAPIGHDARAAVHGGINRSCRLCAFEYALIQNAPNQISGAARPVNLIESRKHCRDIFKLRNFFRPAPIATWQQSGEGQWSRGAPRIRAGRLLERRLQLRPFAAPVKR